MNVYQQATVWALIAAGAATSGCGRKDKGDADALTPIKVDDQAAGDATVSGSDDAAGADAADAIKSDGEALGLRSGDELVANLMAGAHLEMKDLTAEARDEIARLVPSLPKAGGGIAAFTAGHLTNGVKIAYRICSTWMVAAAAGKDERFPANLPWQDGGPVDKFLAFSQFQPVFQNSFWGLDHANAPDDGAVQGIMLAFNEALASDYTNPSTQQVSGVNFLDSVVANCVVVALASPSWFK